MLKFFLRALGGATSAEKAEIREALAEKPVSPEIPENVSGENAESTEKKEDLEEMTSEEKKEGETPTEQKQETAPAPVGEVKETKETHDAIRIEDLMTMDQFNSRFSAFEAKFDAVLKENEDLKAKLAASSKEAGELKEKYENKDFGSQQKQGMSAPDKNANLSFEEYAKQFR